MGKHSLQPQHILIAFCAVAAFFMNGCTNEGCTDPRALNYNSVANKDDGSCIFCDKKITEDEFDLDVTDYNFSSVFYGQKVARVHITHVVDGYDFEDCGESECKVYYEVVNLTNKGITFYYNISFSSFSSFSDLASIPAFQTTERDSIVSTGSFSDVCDVREENAFVNLNSDISYF